MNGISIYSLEGYFARVWAAVPRVSVSVCLLVFIFTLRTCIFYQDLVMVCRFVVDMKNGLLAMRNENVRVLGA